MKKCSLCGETYRDFVDFCFNDGEVLAVDLTHADPDEASALDAPMPRALQTVSQGEQSVPTRSATPLPARTHRRTLLGGRTPSRPGTPPPPPPAASYTPPVATPPAAQQPPDEPFGFDEEDADSSEEVTVVDTSPGSAANMRRDPGLPLADADTRISSPPTLVPAPMDDIHSADTLIEEGVAPITEIPAGSTVPQQAGQRRTPTPAPPQRATPTPAPLPPPPPTGLSSAEPAGGVVDYDPYQEEEDEEKGAAWLVPVLAGVGVLLLLGVAVVGVGVATGGLILGQGPVSEGPDPAPVPVSAPQPSPAVAPVEPKAPANPVPAPDAPVPAPAPANAAAPNPEVVPSPQPDGPGVAATPEPTPAPQPTVEAPAPAPAPVPAVQPAPVAPVPVAVPAPTPAPVVVPEPTPVPVPVAAPEPAPTPVPIVVPAPAPDPEPAPAPTITVVRFSSSPASGAQIRIDGQAKGATPLQLNIAPGTYKLDALLGGHTPISKVISVTGAEITFPLAFQKQAAREGPVMVFYAGRVGDTLFVDGKEIGQLPVRTSLREGRHTFVVEGPAGQRTELAREVTLKEAGTTPLHLNE